ncbi:MAG TPA: hypothetical protein VJQ50_09550 [Terriglobales bacterium]|nr:hypothetical protein [Terriglobales bacterium]
MARRNEPPWANPYSNALNPTNVTSAPNPSATQNHFTHFMSEPQSHYRAMIVDNRISRTLSPLHQLRGKMPTVMNVKRIYRQSLPTNAPLEVEYAHEMDVYRFGSCAAR